MDFILLSIGGQWGKTVQWGMYVKIGAQRLKFVLAKIGLTLGDGVRINLRGRGCRVK